MASKTRKGATKTELNKQAAVKLRVRGYSYRAIAKEIGVSAVTAHKYVTDSLNEAIKDRKESAEQCLNIQLQQVDGVIRGLVPQCIPDEDSVYTEVNEDGEEVAVEFRPNPKAVSELVKFLDHKAKLMGLYVKPEEAKEREPLPWNDDD